MLIWMVLVVVWRRAPIPDELKNSPKYIISFVFFLFFAALIYKIFKFYRSESKTGEKEEKAHKQQEEAREPPPEQKTANAINTEKEALELFELAHPFTAAKLKSRRMELLKKVHPDQGGSNMMARFVNEAYDLLKSKTSD